MTLESSLLATHIDCMRRTYDLCTLYGVLDIDTLFHATEPLRLCRLDWRPSRNSVPSNDGQLSTPQLIFFQVSRISRRQIQTGLDLFACGSTAVICHLEAGNLLTIVELIVRKSLNGPSSQQEDRPRIKKAVKSVTIMHVFVFSTELPRKASRT